MIDTIIKTSCDTDDDVTTELLTAARGTNTSTSSPVNHQSSTRDEQILEHSEGFCIWYPTPATHTTADI